jgi:hypothetical protein
MANEQEVSMNERRFYKRLKRTLRIRWRNEELDFLGVTSDICPGGVFVVTETDLPVLSTLDMEIWLERELPVRCRGEIAWINRGQVISYPAGFGVHFIDLSDDVLATLLLVCGDHYGANRLCESFR